MNKIHHKQYEYKITALLCYGHPICAKTGISSLLYVLNICPRGVALFVPAQAMFKQPKLHFPAESRRHFWVFPIADTHLKPSTYLSLDSWSKVDDNILFVHLKVEVSKIISFSQGYGTRPYFRQLNMTFQFN